MTKAGGWSKLTSLPQHEADLLAGRLKAAGIRSKMVKATDDPAGWLKAFGPGGRFDMYVRASDKGAARKVLAEGGGGGSRSSDRSHHRAIKLIGRALLALALGAAVVALLFEPLG